jgi:hypothetical protein
MQNIKKNEKKENMNVNLNISDNSKQILDSISGDYSKLKKNV